MKEYPVKKKFSTKKGYTFCISIADLTHCETSSDSRLQHTKPNAANVQRVCEQIPNMNE